jgi:DNA-directed RNA polymerase specialized sigma24 family protein
MEGPTSLKKDWVLTQDAFDVLLARLDRDPQRAGQKYEHLRQGLITFFECRGSTSPDAHADQTIDRAARRLLEGKEIYTNNPASYFYGIARNVLKEHWESPGAASAPLDTVPVTRLSEHPGRLQEAQAEREQREQRLDCLEDCLGGLGLKDWELIREYYQGETSVKIENRKLLATKLGIAANALRIRALRIREKLEDCVQRCLDRSSAG